MKGKLTSFFTGVIAALLLVFLPVSALASDGSLTLTIHPIKVLVNGEVFQPKDVQGNDVLVFTYDGTTYAPLRALAEAYGLEVGYDGKNHIATVNGSAQAPVITPAPVSSTDFSAAWTVKEKPVTNYGSEKIFTARYNGSLGTQDFKTWWKSFDRGTIESCAEHLAADVLNDNPGCRITMYFDYNGSMLGTVMAESGYVGANFNAADTWIK